MHIKINSFSKSELRQIAVLHKDNIPEGFISSLGVDFLTMLYGAVQSTPGGILIACSREGAVAGFVSGALSVGSVYKRLLSGYFFPLSLVMLKHALSPGKLKRIMESFL